MSSLKSRDQFIPKKRVNFIVYFCFEKMLKFAKNLEPRNAWSAIFLASFITMESRKIRSSTADLYFGRNLIMFWTSILMVCLGGLMVTALRFGLEDGGSIPQAWEGLAVIHWNSLKQIDIRSSIFWRTLGINPATKKCHFDKLKWRKCEYFNMQIKKL